jgi:hypothetical protein
VTEPKRLEFAPRKRIASHPELVEDFTRRILNLDWAFISDESSLWDFHTDKTNETMITRIDEVYGVDVSDIKSAKILEILARIAKETPLG